MSDDVIETTPCTNCKRDILSSNFVIHAIHCQRNIHLCPKCNEPVNHNQQAEHDEANHANVYCTSCHIQVEKCKLNTHLSEDCPNRILKCQICGIDIGASDLSEHENYCGARTEKCLECGEFVMLKYKQLHLDSNHTFIKLSDELGPSPSWQNGRRFLGNFLTDVNSWTPKPSQSSQKKKNRLRNHLVSDDEEKKQQKSTIAWNSPEKRGSDWNNLEKSQESLSTGALKKTVTSKNSALLLSDKSYYNVEENKMKKEVNKVAKKPLKQDNENTFELDRLLALSISEEINGETLPKQDNRIVADENDDFMYALEVQQKLNELNDEKDDTANDHLLARLASESDGSNLKNRNAFIDSIEKDDNELFRNIFTDRSEPKTQRKLDINYYSDDSDDDFLLYSKKRMDKNEILSLPCEFCKALIPSEDLILHQTGCTSGLEKTNHETHNPIPKSSPKDDDNLEIPCEFCNRPIKIWVLENHQAHCNERGDNANAYKTPSPKHPVAKNEKKTNAMSNLRSMNMRSKTGLQNGISPSSPRLSGAGTRSEFLTKDNTEREKNLRRSINESSGAVPRTNRSD